LGVTHSPNAYTYVLQYNCSCLKYFIPGSLGQKLVCVPPCIQSPFITYTVHYTVQSHYLLEFIYPFMQQQSVHVQVTKLLTVVFYPIDYCLECVM